jgi:hypothetical protein
MRIVLAMSDMEERGLGANGKQTICCPGSLSLTRLLPPSERGRFHSISKHQIWPVEHDPKLIEDIATEQDVGLIMTG